VEANFKFSTTILLLVFSIACQPSVKFSSESSNENSAINSEVSDEKRVSQEKKIEENLSSQREQKERQSPEKPSILHWTNTSATT